MRYDPDSRPRRTVRLQGYDYSRKGAYFVTIGTQNRDCLFGDVAAGEVRLTDAGRMVCLEWEALQSRFPDVSLDAFVVMPNHVHGVIVMGSHCDAYPIVGAGLVPACPTVVDTIVGAVPVPFHPDVDSIVGACPVPARPGGATLGGVIGAFKSRVTVEYIRGVKSLAWPPFAGRLWQRNYYEHIIRHEDSLNRIRQYILDNPGMWESDRENPAIAATEVGETWST